MDIECGKQWCKACGDCMCPNCDCFDEGKRMFAGYCHLCNTVDEDWGKEHYNVGEQMKERNGENGQTERCLGCAYTGEHCRFKGGNNREFNMKIWDTHGCAGCVIIGEELED